MTLTHPKSDFLMKSTAHRFNSQVIAALQNETLQQALTRTQHHFVEKRRQAVHNLPEFEILRQQGAEIREHSLAHLDFYLNQLETQILAQGGQVHWAGTSEQACQQILTICQDAQAQYVIKGKSMISEEINLNSTLENAGLTVTETDLGEYIIQLAHEPPSHIIAPAVHKTREQVATLFHTHHQVYGFTQQLSEIPELVNEARQVLREKFLQAEVGIIGANFLVAETGSAVLVTNEGNGDLTSLLPKIHIVLASIEKVVPTLEEVTVLLRLLARSATGQEISTYTSFFTGPARNDDTEGPTAFHLVLLDNGRSKLLGTEFKDIFRCIRCGACLNHCPIYGSIGGHAYGWVYPGPMGAILTPLLLGIDKAKDLPNASTLCGQCEPVCPVKIPLPNLLRKLRKKQQQMGLTPFSSRLGLLGWAWLAKRPSLYQSVVNLKIRLLTRWGRKKGCFRYLPFAKNWTISRDMPVPQQAETFLNAWQKSKLPAKNDESSP